MRQAVILAIALILGFWSAIPQRASAETATGAEMETVCRNWLSYLIYQKGSWAGETNPRIAEVHDMFADGVLLARCFSITPRGHVVIPVLKELPPIQVYSEEWGFDASETVGLPQLVREILQHRTGLYADTYGSLNATQPQDGSALLGHRHRKEWDLFLDAPEQFLFRLQTGTFEPLREVPPLLTTSWHQGAPYNNFCPMGDGDRCVVGCTATAMAQIMRYHQWPPYGLGGHSYYWGGDQSCGGNVGGGELYADFSDPYDWANMMDDCDGGCTQIEQDAVAELCYEVGAAFEMQYGACGSGAWPNDVAMVDYFRYEPATSWVYRGDHSADSWFDLIKVELNDYRPIWYSYLLTGAGHAIVCDGWRDTGGLHQYHMNYGWGGAATAWYTIDDLYDQVYDPEYERMILGLAPPPGYACCFGQDCQILKEEVCEGMGGQWLFGFDACDPNPCVELYACCTGDDICQLLTVEGCAAAGGDFIAGIDSCDPNPCLDYACCLDQSCQLMREQDCVRAGGDWLIGSNNCTPNPCLSFACCADTSCQVLREQDCLDLGGDWISGTEACDPNPCLPYACCVDQMCQILAQEECAAAGGEWRVGAESCEPNPCISFVVRSDGTGDFPTIQAAIEAAAHGQTIELVDGVFTGDGNRDLDYGGKAITIRSISGAPDSCIIDCQGSDGDQHRGVDFHSGEDASSILEGVTITGGYMSTYSGGGIQCRNNSCPTIRNCVVRDNYSGASGGGIFTNGSQPSITFCAIVDNEAVNGGGLLFQSSDPILVRNCTISGNRAGAHGGGVYCFGTDMTMENSIVAFSAEGEALHNYYSDIVLTCSDVYGNAGGDWIGCIEGQNEINGNICADPFFCDATAGDYRLDAGSACAPFSPPNEECDLIGACPVGCLLEEVPDDPRSLRAPYLGPGVPNPFRGTIVITYAVPSSRGALPVVLDVFDPLGRLVRTLADRRQTAGVYAVTWDGRNERGEAVAAGVYLCRLYLAGETLKRQVVLIR